MTGESEITREIFLYGNSATAAGESIGEPRTVHQEHARDREEFGEFYRRFAPLVHGILLARVPYDQVRDLVQEVFLAAYKDLPNLREPQAAGAWLARIARNEAVEYYRQRRPAEELSESIQDKKKYTSEAIEILAAIRTLPETYRETLVLRLVEGMTGKEIAERTGLTPESVRVNLHRGMDQLRQKLGIRGAK